MNPVMWTGVSPPCISPTSNAKIVNQRDAVPWMTPQLWYSPRPQLEVKRVFTSLALNESLLGQPSVAEAAGKNLQHEKYIHIVMACVKKNLHLWGFVAKIPSLRRAIAKDLSLAQLRLANFHRKALRVGQCFDRHVWLTEKKQRGNTLTGLVTIAVAD